MAIGRESKSNKIYLIDFGLAKYYKDKSTSEHIPFRKNKDLTGTPIYSSINSHKGFEESRRDDIESLLYTILFFLRGNLPWEAIHHENHDAKFENIMRMKIYISVEDLCKELPSNLFIKI